MFGDDHCMRDNITEGETSVPAFQLSSKVSSSSPKGLGPASTGDHTPAETVDIPSIFRQAKRAALLMSRLAAEKR